MVNKVSRGHTPSYGDHSHNDPVASKQVLDLSKGVSNVVNKLDSAKFKGKTTGFSTHPKDKTSDKVKNVTKNILKK